MIRALLVGTQAATMVLLSGMFFRQGEVKLGAAQVLLAGVTWLVYS